MLSTENLVVANSFITCVNASTSRVDVARLLATAEFAFTALRLNARTKLDIKCVTLAEMERLHIIHMDEPGATDVLSFPMDELRAPADDEIAPAGELGDIILCPDFAAPQASTAGHSLEDELDLLLIHGILHCLGHDHAEPEEHAVMFGLQDELLSALKEERGAL